MLVLGRKVGEVIQIGEDIEVCVIEINNGVVKLGINAPKKMKILRKELITEVINENLQSVKDIEKIMNKLK